MFLQTSSGLIHSRAIVRISALNTRTTGDFHEIEYHIGTEARETRATADAVATFLSEVPT
jgi:hypothetical protein